jgi:membrane associated rhomboid family serine protease
MSSIINDLKLMFFKRDIMMRLILINVIVFVFALLVNVFCLLLQLPNPVEYIIREFLMLPSNLKTLAYTPWSIITYMFLHSGIFHILFNMLVLYWFGNIYQEYLGKQKFMYTYFLSGVFGGLFYVLCYNVFPYFSNSVESSKALGASAAVMGIVFATATLLPNFSIVLAIFGPIRLKYIAFFYLLIDLVGISSANAGGHLAHIGGALFGFLFIKQLQNGNDWTKFPVKMIDGISGLFKPKKIKVAYRNPSVNTNKKQDVTQAEIDRVLDKISQSGYENLSAKEKEILFKAGKQ